MRGLLTVFILVCFSITVYSQTYKLNISARVDTSNSNNREIFQLFSQYLNSSPEIIGENLYWNEQEFKKYTEVEMLPDRSLWSMLYINSMESFLKQHKAIVLQIDSVDINLYQIKTLFYTDEDSPQKIPYITKHFLSKNESGNFRLKNAIDYLTLKWEHRNYGMIKFVIHPSCKFNVQQASEADEFCKSIAKKFDLELKPFTYYILPNSDVYGELLNFSYWTYYIGGQTISPLREIFTTYGNTSYPHEFIHLIFPLRVDGKTTPRIINEGIASWLGGVKYNVSFKDALTQVSQVLKKETKVSFKDILDETIRNEFDSSILYVTGGVLCQMAYEKNGKDAIMKLYYSDNDNFISVLEAIFNLPFEEIERKVIEYILSH